HPSVPRAGSFRSGGRLHLVMAGGIIPLRRATSSRFGGRLRKESAAKKVELDMFAAPRPVVFLAVHDPGLLGMKRQPAFCEATSDGLQHRSGFQRSRFAAYSVHVSPSAPAAASSSRSAKAASSRSTVRGWKSAVNFSFFLCLAACRTRVSAGDTLSRFCARRVLCWSAFPSAPALGSAADCSALFVGFKSCRVGGGALGCLRANLRPPLKLDVQFSRIQLSWMGLRSLKRRYQRDEADQLEL